MLKRNCCSGEVQPEIQKNGYLDASAAEKLAQQLP